ncbi:esterase [Opitutaceae bacterium TAV5]|nr:esterase [Opitutaceae bacterium TAV5]
MVYGKRQDRPLLMDVIQPERPNGAGVIVMVSGSWKSRTGPFDPWLAAPLLRRGYTLFAVHHISQPEVTIMDIVADVNRAVRFVRYHAGDYGVNPEKIGVTGGSSGGHLSLMLATRGGEGAADAADPVERQSSAVQAVAVFFPVTDLLNLGNSTQNLHDDGPPKSYVRGFGLASRDPGPWRPVGREMSPIYHIPAAMPPTLIIHGTADTLVPLDQSVRFREEARRHGTEVELIERPGKNHGWIGMITDIRLFADWFDRTLRG